MKKIIAYIGTRKGEDSNTYKFINTILKKCTEKDNNINYEIITSNNYKIDNCIGCEVCFTHGVCSIQKNDEINKIKDKMLQADMVILASPVYAHNVSGDMKTFIDRISHWLHTMKLSGKYAAVVSTTSSNGHLTVINYLEKITTLLGMKLLFKINCTLMDDEEFGSEMWVEEKTEELAEKIISSLYEPIISTNSLESVFNVMKSRYEDMKKSEKIIPSFIEPEEIGFFEHNNYQDFLNYRYNKKLGE